MADYPSLPQMEGTKLVPRSGMKTITASNLQVRVRQVASSAFLDPTVVHTSLTGAQWATLQSFYNANRAGTFTFTLVADGTLLSTCVFAEKPFECTPKIGPNAIALFDVTVYLMQAS
jgi:hypothetical protein